MRVDKRRKRTWHAGFGLGGARVVWDSVVRTSGHASCVGVHGRERTCGVARECMCMCDYVSRYVAFE
jgi:hypothetical protein